MNFIVKAVIFLIRAFAVVFFFFCYPKLMLKGFKDFFKYGIKYFYNKYIKKTNESDA